MTDAPGNVVQPIITLWLGVTRPEWFKRMLDSCEIQGVPYEVVWSDATVPSMILELTRYPNMVRCERVVHDKAAHTYFQAMNALILSITGKYVIYASDDFEFRPECFKAIQDTLDVYGHIGAVSCYLSERGLSCRMFEDNGLVLAIRREALIEVGGFTTSYEFYSNDTDLTYKLAEARWGVIRVPGACLIHHYVVDEGRADHSASLERDRKHFESLWTPARLALARETFNRYRVEDGPFKCPMHHD